MDNIHRYRADIPERCTLRGIKFSYRAQSGLQGYICRTCALLRNPDDSATGLVPRIAP
jgi:hypothetical protein